MHKRRTGYAQDHSLSFHIFQHLVSCIPLLSTLERRHSRHDRRLPIHLRKHPMGTAQHIRRLIIHAWIFRRTIPRQIRNNGMRGTTTTCARTKRRGHLGRRRHGVLTLQSDKLPQNTAQLRPGIQMGVQTARERPSRPWIRPWNNRFYFQHQ